MSSSYDLSSGVLGATKLSKSLNESGPITERNADFFLAAAVTPLAQKNGSVSWHIAANSLYVRQILQCCPVVP